MVFDLNGVHRIVLQYCHCPSNPAPHEIQLLRARWFPATVFRPSTSFSFQLLDFFHKLQDQNKCNSYDFYHTIMQRTDNAGIEPEIVSSGLSLLQDNSSPTVPVQRNLSRLSPLEPSQTSKARWCWPPMWWTWFDVEWKSRNVMPSMSPPRKEYCSALGSPWVCLTM